MRLASTVAFFAALAFHVSGQAIIDTFSYDGPPGHTRWTEWATTPGSRIDFLYCTHNVPDSLIIEMCDVRLTFFPGEYYLGGQQGYTEYSYTPSGGLQVVNQADIVPIGIRYHGNCYDPSGAIWIHITVPAGCCQMRWGVIGNKNYLTVYSLRVEQMFLAPVVPIATIDTFSCQYAYNQIRYIDCDPYLYRFADSSIRDKPEIEHPRCLDLGSIVFPLHPTYDTFNLQAGPYEVTISNSVCSRTWTFLLVDDYPCHLYAPNAIHGGSWAQNGVFSLYCDRDLDYELWVYDRWGEMLYNGRHTTNDGDGWDGTFRGKECPPGVYVWRAVISGEYVRAGDVTVVR